ncbi:hypothetical protein ACH5RR_007469 [Cinchona calisaya]|uniref:WRC domain-containing protein n=1 Tax=Cinchona calisaya TaxID=153742 RepID=A0ABD3ARW6_9GENT
MRIRKRFPPSSIPSGALSDPQHNRFPVVQPQIQSNSHENLYAVQEEAKNYHHTKSDPQNQPFLQAATSHQEMMIPSGNPRWDFFTGHTEEKMKQKEIEDYEKWKEEEAEKSGNDTRKEIMQVELSMQLVPQPSSISPTSPVDERWCEEDKYVPLKKRKGNFKRMNSEGKETMILKPKMKSKTNKKCLDQNVDHVHVEEEMIKNTIATSSSSGVKKKSSKRGSVIMEGSRCSRVNGRGWRCCQQTLVGYSLCEHHLGKGRLRSMTSCVRNRAMTNNNTNKIGANEKDEIAPPTIPTSVEKQDNDEDCGDHEGVAEKKPLMVVPKKRMKIGAVKARSISSLLDQTNNAIVASNGNKFSG